MLLLKPKIQSEPSPRTLRIKAFVRFIRMHGKEKLGELLIKNQQHGIYYGHNRDYDHLESEEKVISILLYI